MDKWGNEWGDKWESDGHTLYIEPEGAGGFLRAARFTSGLYEDWQVWVFQRDDHVDHFYKAPRGTLLTCGPTGRGWSVNFDNVLGHAGVHPVPARSALGTLRRNDVERTPVYMQALEVLSREDRHQSSPRPGDVGGIAYLLRDVPALDLRAGDLLIRAEVGKLRAPLRGRVRPLTIDDYEVAKTEREADGPDLYAEISTSGTSRTADDFLKTRRMWGRSFKVWRSRLLAVRPFRSVASEPVHAESDDAAIFELLSQVGGRPLSE